MASLNLFVPPVMTTRRPSVVCRATAAKSGGGSEEKGFLDWLSTALQKESLLEVDPLLQKVEDNSPSPPPKKGTVSISSKKGTVSSVAPKKKNGGFGGFFAKE